MPKKNGLQAIAEIKEIYAKINRNIPKGIELKLPIIILITSTDGSSKF
jgi:hypothetical protein